MVKVIKRHLVIVGCGIEGLMTGLIAAEHGLKDVVVYDVPESKNLGPDSLRNHAWLQSGLLYSDKKNRPAGLRMWAWGRRMHEILGLSIPDIPGVFRLHGETSADAFREWATDLKILNTIHLLDEGRARMMLGAFYQEGFIHYQVPDTLFKEADIMNKAKYLARENGVHFRKSRVDFIPEPNCPIGFLIKTDDGVVEAKFVILCAGRGILALLNQLGVEHPLTVFQSCLLRVRCGDVMQIPLLVDISEGMPTSGLSVVQHTSLALPPDGCLVIGNKARRALQAEEILLRKVTPDEDYNLRKMVPLGLIPEERGHALSVIACCKTEALVKTPESSVNSLVKTPESSVDSWKESWPQHPGLVAVVPGKATLSLYAAYEALKLIRPGEDFSSIAPPGMELSDPFIMHQEHELDELEGGSEINPDSPEGPWIN